MLVNLGSNAIKFIQGGVSFKFAVVECSNGGTMIRCDIRDTGVGIATDRIAGLLQPSVQVDASTDPRAHSTRDEGCRGKMSRGGHGWLSV